MTRRISARSLMAVLAFLAALPVVTILHEILILSVASLLSGFVKVGLLARLIRSFVASPVYAQLMVETMGGVRTHGLAIYGWAGHVLHERFPSHFLRPEWTAHGALASAVLADGSTVLSLLITRALVEAVLIILGALLVHVGLQGSTILDVLKTGRRRLRVCVGLGLFVQAQAIWALFQLTHSPALVKLEDTGIGFGLSVLFQLNANQYAWLMTTALPLLIPFVLAVVALIASRIACLLIDTRIADPRAGHWLRSSKDRWLVNGSAASLGVMLLIVGALPFSHGYFGLAKTRLAAKGKLDMTPASPAPAATPLYPVAPVAAFAIPTGASERQAERTPADQPVAERILSDQPTSELAVALAPTPTRTPTSTPTRTPTAARPTAATILRTEGLTATPKPSSTPVASATHTVAPSPTPLPSPTREPTATPRPTGPAVVTLRYSPQGSTLVVNGQDTIVAGMNYNVNYTELADEIKQPRHARDFRILRDAGVNSIVGWGVYDEATLAFAHENDIGVIMPFELDPQGPFEDKNYREQIKAGFREYVQRFKAFPAVWAWNPGGDELMHRMDTEQHRTPDKLQAAADFLVELAAWAYDADPNHVSMIKEPRDWYIPYLDRAIAARRADVLQPDPSRYLIYGVNVYGQPEEIANALQIARRATEEHLQIGFVIGEYGPFGLPRESRPANYALIADVVYQVSPMGGYVYVFGPDQPNPQAPNPYDPLRLMVNEFSLLDIDGAPIDGSFDALVAKWHQVRPRAAAAVTTPTPVVRQ